MIDYIVYKILNIAATKFNTFRSSSLVRLTDYDVCNSREFFFDFSDRTTHLGDRLFFFPLIDLLVKAGYPVRIANGDKLTGVLLQKIISFSPAQSNKPSETECVIFPAPSFLNFKKIYKKFAVVDFTDTNCSRKISEEIVCSFKNKFNLCLNDVTFDVKSNKAADSIQKIIPSEYNYYIFSNYVDSGRFRKLFINEKKLVQKALQLKREGYKIIHVGSVNDIASDQRCYPFVDIDMRGKTNISDIVDIVNSPNVIGALTYDNFIMHLVGMYGKVAYVLFRGRFLKKNRAHHLLYVNNTFFRSEEKLLYL